MTWTSKFNLQDLLALDTKVDVDFLLDDLKNRWGLFPNDLNLVPMEAYKHVAAALALLMLMGRRPGPNGLPVGFPPSVAATIEGMARLAIHLRQPPGPPASIITVVQS